jgi:hypothetical protein
MFEGPTQLCNHCGMNDDNGNVLIFVSLISQIYMIDTSTIHQHQIFYEHNLPPKILDMYFQSYFMQ